MLVCNQYNVTKYSSPLFPVITLKRLFLYAIFADLLQMFVYFRQTIGNASSKAVEVFDERNNKWIMCFDVEMVSCGSAIVAI